MMKYFLSILILLTHFSATNIFSNICTPVDNVCGQEKETPEAKKQKEQELKNAKLKQILAAFTPDFLVTEQLPQDLILKDKIKKLFFEADPEMTSNPFENNKRGICKKAIKEFGATEIMLHTDDDFRISSLYFKRPNALLNIIYVTGYFLDQTPTKQWATPFALLFPTFNILTYDWRGFGDSEGKRGDRFGKTDFGTNAYLDIQAAIDFLKKQNDKPIVLVGFCAGAAMTMKATIEAQKVGKKTANALVLNSLFSEFANQFNRASIVSENRFYMRAIAHMGIGKAILQNSLSGSFFDLKPIDMIEQITIPCYFEHFILDQSAIVEEGIQVFNKSKAFKKFELSTVGIHVRIHKDAPFQVRNNFYEFLWQSKLLSKEQIDSIKIQDFEDDQKILNKK